MATTSSFYAVLCAIMVGAVVPQHLLSLAVVLGAISFTVLASGLGFTKCLRHFYHQAVSVCNVRIASSTGPEAHRRDVLNLPVSQHVEQPTNYNLAKCRKQADISSAILACERIYGLEAHPQVGPNLLAPYHEENAADNELSKCWKSSDIANAISAFEQASRLESHQQVCLSAPPLPNHAEHVINDDLSKCWKSADIASAILAFEQASCLEPHDQVHHNMSTPTVLENVCDSATALVDDCKGGLSSGLLECHASDELSKCWKSDEITSVILAFEEIFEDMTDAAHLHTAMQAFVKRS